MKTIAETFFGEDGLWWTIPLIVFCAIVLWWVVLHYEPRGRSQRITDLLMENEMNQQVNQPTTGLAPDDAARIKDSIEQIDAIWALEGFQPDRVVRTIDAAVLAGRVTFGQAANEMDEYVEKHKTTDGFIETRSWA